MNKFFVINAKNLLVSILIIMLMITIYLSGDSLIDNVVETATNNRLLPIYSVETEDKKVALTFDCAWGADDIPSIVQTLENNNVKATFFTVGDWVKKYPEVINTLNEAGMEIR